jgi:hypothetical protein
LLATRPAVDAVEQFDGDAVFGHFTLLWFAASAPRLSQLVPETNEVQSKQSP